jgi:hypothetical protein
VSSAASDGSDSFTSLMQPKASSRDLKSFLDIPSGIRFACLFAIFPLSRYHPLTSSPSHPRPSPPNAQKRAKVEDVSPNPNAESFAGMADDPNLIALGSMAAMPNFHHHPNFGLAYGGGLVQPMMQHMSFLGTRAAAPPRRRRSLHVRLRPRVLRHAPRDREWRRGGHAGRLRRRRGRGRSSANEADVGDDPPRLCGHADDELPGGLGGPRGVRWELPPSPAGRVDRFPGGGTTTGSGQRRRCTLGWSRWATSWSSCSSPRSGQGGAITRIRS